MSLANSAGAEVVRFPGQLCVQVSVRKHQQILRLKAHVEQSVLNLSIESLRNSGLLTLPDVETASYGCII